MPDRTVIAQQLHRRAQLPTKPGQLSDHALGQRRQLAMFTRPLPRHAPRSGFHCATKTTAPDPRSFRKTLFGCLLHGPLSVEQPYTLLAFQRRGMAAAALAAHSSPTTPACRSTHSATMSAAPARSGTQPATRFEATTSNERHAYTSQQPEPRNYCQRRVLPWQRASRSN